MPTQPVLNADETGHRTNGAKRWLWTLVAPTFVFYTITTSRGADVLRRLLGARFGGVLGSDRLRPADQVARTVPCHRSAYSASVVRYPLYTPTVVHHPTG